MKKSFLILFMFMVMCGFMIGGGAKSVEAKAIKIAVMYP